MAGQIRITPEQMNTRARQYRQEADEVNRVILRMDALLEALLGEWEGASSEAYAARFRELRPGFIKAEALIREIAMALDLAAGRIAETDSMITGQFRA